MTTTTSPTSLFRMPPFSPLPSRVTTSAGSISRASSEQSPPRPAAPLRRAVASDRHARPVASDRHARAMAPCRAPCRAPCQIEASHPYRLSQPQSWRMDGCLAQAAAATTNTCRLLSGCLPLSFGQVEETTQSRAPLRLTAANSLLAWLLLLLLPLCLVVLDALLS